METSQWMIAITQNLIAALIVWMFSRFVSNNKESIKSVMGVAIPATKKILPPMLRVASHVLVYWYLITQIRNVATDPAPIEKMDIVILAFWVFWLNMYFVRTVMTRHERNVPA